MGNVGIFVGAVLLATAVIALVAWAVMLVFDPATAGAYTVSYEQAIWITLLAGILTSGSQAYRLN